MKDLDDSLFIYKNAISKGQQKTLNYIKNNITPDIDTISVEGLAKCIEQYKNSKGRMLAYGSIKCIFYTMMKYRRHDWDIKEMKKWKNSFWIKTNHFTLMVDHYSADMESSIKDMIEYFVSYFFGVATTISRSYYYTSLAVCITLATNLRISEIKQLTKKHIRQILNDEHLTIRIKKKKKSIQIMANKTLIREILSRLDNFSELEMLVPISKSSINYIIRQNVHNSNVIGQKIGIQSIRKVNTTIIIGNIDLETAQYFNRHTNRNITFDHYNTKTYIAPAINEVIKTVYN